MSGWLEPVVRALGGCGAPVRIFCRDDDGGWNDDALLALVRVHARRRIPLDVAVIPTAATPSLVAQLAPFRAALVGVHQHGCEHANHETLGRRCEFGPSRSAHAQRADIVRGRARLTELFGADVDAVFTPPWNRCTAETVGVLADLGFRALSRDVGAAPLALQPPLVELPVAIDWMKFRRDGVPELAALGQRVAAALDAAATSDDRPIGLMFHHAVMTAADLEAVDALLAVLASSPRAACVRMRDLLPPADGAAVGSREVDAA